MRLAGPLRSEAGFTVQELLVVLVVGSLVVGFAYSLLAFTQKVIGRGEKRASLEENLDSILFTLSRDIGRARGILLLTDTSLTLSRGVDLEDAWHFGGPDILRNGESLTSGGKVTYRLIIVEEKPDDTSSHSSELRRFSVSLSAFTRSDSLQRQIVVALPPSSRWSMEPPHEQERIWTPLN